MDPMDSRERILVALDTTDVDRAAALARELSGHVGGIKLGKEFFTANGPQGVRAVVSDAQPLFLDLKFHDIPNTVAGAVRSAMEMNPMMLNVHAAGGAAMMRAAAAAVAEAGAARPLLIAVTVLTSLGDEDLDDIGVNATAAIRWRDWPNWHSIAAWMVLFVRRAKLKSCATPAALISRRWFPASVPNGQSKAIRNAS